jgi:hypothetical protein
LSFYLAVTGHSRFVPPGDFKAANKKRLRSLPTHVTTPPTAVQETIVAKEDEDYIDDMLQKVHFFFFDY